MKIKTGKGLDDLLTYLAELQDPSLTIVPKTKQLHIICSRNASGTELYQIHTDKIRDTYRNRKKSKGCTYASLKKALTLNQCLMSADYSYTVLSYASTAAHLDSHGRLLTRWVLLDPCCPYTIDDKGIPHFETIMLPFDSTEYKVMVETGIALFDREAEIIYPFLQEALYTVGKTIEASAVFKKGKNTGLGSALLIAEKILSVKNIQLIHTKISDRVCPVTCVAGQRFIMYDSQAFLNAILKKIADAGIYTVSAWEISELEKKVNIHLIRFGFEPDQMSEEGFVIKTSSIAGMAMSISSFVKIDGVIIYLKRNCKRHEAEKNISYSNIADAIFDGLLESFDIFYKKKRILEKNDIQFFSCYLTKLKKLIGLKRFADLNFDELPSNGWDMFQYLVSQISNLKFDNDKLSWVYSDILDSMLRTL